MLQLMRDKSKSWATIIIVAIIAFMMAITGLESLGPNPNNPNVASVNGEDITSAQLSQSLDQQRRVIAQRMGGRFDPSMIDEKMFTDSVLQSLIERSLQLQDAEKNNMDIGPQVLDRMIVEMPEFQTDGQFDKDRFRMLIRNAGMTPLGFRSMLRDQALLTHLRSGLADSEFVTAAEVKRLSSLENQTRDIAWLTLPIAPVIEKVQPSDDEINTFYQQHKDDYMLPEKVAVNYIQLDKALLAKAVKIDDESIANEYQLRIDELKENAAGQQKVSSILIESGAKRTKEEAQQRAADVLKKVKSGADFSKLAKEFSDDIATADKGGDMGLVEPGFYGDVFDDTVASLKSGQVSEVIETDYGHQILKVTREQQKLPSLDEMRSEIMSFLTEQEADKVFLEKSRLLADVSFEAADLTQPAEEVGVTINTTVPFSREGGKGITADRKVISAAFSDEVLVQGSNSEVIELTDGVLVVLRVKDHQKPVVIPLTDVKSSVITSIKKEKAQQQLTEKAKELIADIKSGDAKEVAKKAGLTWGEAKKAKRRQSDVNREILAKAFKLAHPDSDNPELASVELLNGDLAVISLSAVYPGEFSDAEKSRTKGLKDYLAGSNVREIYDEYIQSIKAQGKITIKLKDKSKKEG